jgi:hypothetical protein
MLPSMSPALRAPPAPPGIIRPGSLGNEWRWHEMTEHHSFQPGLFPDESPMQIGTDRSRPCTFNTSGAVTGNY